MRVRVRVRVLVHECAYACAYVCARVRAWVEDTKANEAVHRSKLLREIGSPGGSSKNAHTSWGMGPNMELFVGHVTDKKNQSA